MNGSIGTVVPGARHAEDRDDEIQAGRIGGSR
jgi:hypothetical protein